jgi:hypothetical protein
MSDTVSFSYQLIGKGWSRARLTLDEDSVEMKASYLSDALGDLLEALIRLQYGARTARVSWDEEPGEFRWLLTRHGKGIAVRVLWFEDDWDEVGTERLRGRADLDAFIHAIALEAYAVLAEYGEQGYREHWIEHPFPTFSLSFLR